MKRYGVARYLTPEQRERAVQATYELVSVGNGCERGCCWHKGENIPAARRVTRFDDGRFMCQCPLMVALDVRLGLDPWDFEALVAKSPDGSNLGALRAAQRFMHDIDSGKISPADVAGALGGAAR